MSPEPSGLKQDKHSQTVKARPALRKFFVKELVKSVGEGVSGGGTWSHDVRTGHPPSDLDGRAGWLVRLTTTSPGGGRHRA